MRKTRYRIIALFICTMLLMQGCLLNNRGHAKARDELSSAIVNVLNPEILRFSGCGHGNSRYDPEDLIEYNLMIESINNTELAEQVRNLYAVTNEVLSYESYSNKRIRIRINSYHFQYGVINCVAQLSNYEPDDNSVTDHITYIGVGGIDDMTEGYNSHHRYELNSTVFWGEFSEVDEFDFSRYVEYQSEIELVQPCVEAIQNYLMQQYEDLISFGDITASTDSGHTPYLSWGIHINEDNTESNDYVSTTELVDSIRISLNDYYTNHPDDEFLNLRLIIGFSISEDDYWGQIENYNRSNKELLGGFYSVYYRNATVDEIIQCEGITRIVMYQRSIEEIITVINEMESIEHIYVSSGDLCDELSSEYNQITFSVT